MSSPAIVADMPPPVMNKCLVCNARNAKQHYGSWCCNGCKGFFWRTISSKRHYICMSGGNAAKCEIRDGRRNSCRCCRLKRCFEVGMDPNLIRDSWGKSTAATAFKQRNGGNNSSQHEEDETMDLSPSPGSSSPNASSPSMKSENQSQNGEWSEMGKISTTMKKKMTQKKMEKMKEAREEEMRKENGGGGMMPPPDGRNIQLLADYLEWIQSLPELSLFSEQDKNVLILNRSRPSGWLILAGQHLFSSSAADCPPLFRSTPFAAPHKLEVLQREIVAPLKHWEACPMELELLRLICFFSTVPLLSAEGKKMVEVIHGTYSRSLTELSLKKSLHEGGGGDRQQQNPHWLDMASIGHSVFRANQIVHLLAVVEKIAHQYD